MDQLQIAAILSGRMSTGEAHSALPNAPVVPDAASIPQRGRGVLASALRRIADAVAPPVPVTASRFTLSSGRGGGAARWDESHCRPSPTTSA